MDINRIYNMDWIKGLKILPDKCVNTCVTSPPYWGLRDYGVGGQLGLEQTPEEYVKKMVDGFREVRRVLRDDGTLWLNLGDSYATSGGVVQSHRDSSGGIGRKGTRGTQPYHASGGGFDRPSTIGNGLKPKDLIGIPWRVAFALQTDGWYLRSDIIWHKPNPMPESVTDRPTKAHEYIFLMSKSERYYYDHEAIKEPAVYGLTPTGVGFGHGTDADARSRGRIRESKKRGEFNGKTNSMPGREAFRAIQDYRNKRTVWTVPTKPFSETHFATFPPDLIKPCILAGAPIGGIVLDPFMGAGTTALTAWELGRNYLGFELNPEYCMIAEKRIQKAQRRKESFGIPLFSGERG